MKKLTIFIIVLCINNLGYTQNDLQYYTVRAIQNSPLLKDNKNQIAAKEYDIEMLKAQYTKPKVGVVVNFMFSPIISTDNNATSFVGNAQSATDYYGYDLAYSNGGNYQAMLNVTQPIFNRKSLQIASEQIHVSNQIIQNNNTLSQHDIEKVVTDQYLRCLQDDKQIDYIKSMVTLLATQKVMLNKLVESSIYKQSDLTLLNIEYQNFLAQQTVLEANYRRDLMDLNILCGINDTALIRIQNSDLVLNGMVLNSMFLEKYHLDSLNLMALQNTYALKYKPQINLFANTGLNAVYLQDIPQRFGLSAGLSFSYTIFDGNQKMINKSKTKVLGESISFYKNNFITQNTIRKSRILSELTAILKRITITELQLKEYKILLNSYKQEISSGQLSIINYTMALKNLVIVQRDHTMLYSQQQSLINTYNYWNW